MIRKLPLLSMAMILGSIFFTQTSQAQINYSQDFETSDGSSSAYEFDTDPDGFGCTATSLWANLWWFDSYEKYFVSELVGSSNGLPATIGFDYKVVTYSDFLAYPNSPDWGSITVQYGTSASGPWTDIQTIDPSNHVESATCAPFSATFTPPPGALYYRISAFVNSEEDIDLLFFVDNVSVTQAAAPACTGAPAASEATGVVGCIGSQTTLTLLPYYTDSGLTFQWQSSVDGTTFTDIDGATQFAYIATAGVDAVWYRAVITCTDSGLSATSGAKEVVTSLLCYCAPQITSDVEPVTNVVFAGIDNSSSPVVNGSPALEDFRGSVEAGTVVAGQSYTITLQGNTAGTFTNYFTIYIDLNADGDYSDDGEAMNLSQTLYSSTGTDGQTVTGTIEIPATATAGLTSFRVFKRFYDYATDPCGSYSYGQAEDYSLQIEPVNSVVGFNKANFKYSPNPVNNELNLQYTANMENVQVINMLGQTVLTKNNIGATDAKLDMSGLQAGTYLVKVGDAQGASITVKVMKQ